MEEHLPEAVVYSGNKDLKTVKYSEITAVLVEAMKEQQQQIDNLKSEIEDLKGQTLLGHLKLNKKESVLLQFLGYCQLMILT